MKVLEAVRIYLLFLRRFQSTAVIDMLLDYCAVNYLFYITKNNDKQIYNLTYKVVKIFCPKLNALLFREAIKMFWGGFRLFF